MPFAATASSGLFMRLAFRSAARGRPSHQCVDASGCSGTAGQRQRPYDDPGARWRHVAEVHQAFKVPGAAGQRYGGVHRKRVADAAWVDAQRIDADAGDTALDEQPGGILANARKMQSPTTPTKRSGSSQKASHPV